MATNIAAPPGDGRHQRDFSAWFVHSLKGISGIATALAAIAAFITTVQVFGGTTNRTLHALLQHRQTVHLAMLVVMLIYTCLIMDRVTRHRPGIPRRMARRTMNFFFHWLAIIVLWTVFYLTQSAEEWQIPGVPDGVINGWFPNLLNRLPIPFFFALYLVVSNKWRLYTAVPWAVAWILFLIIITAADATFHFARNPEVVRNAQVLAAAKQVGTAEALEQAQIDTAARDARSSSLAWIRYVQLMAATVECLVISMLVGRMDSKLLPVPWPFTVLMYFYGPIQILFAVSPPAAALNVLFLAAMVCKASLILFVTWVLLTNLLPMFLLNLAEIEAVVDRLLDAAARPQSPTVAAAVANLSDLAPPAGNPAGAATGTGVAAPPDVPYHGADAAAPTGSARVSNAPPQFPGAMSATPRSAPTESSTRRVDKGLLSRRYSDDGADDLAPDPDLLLSHQLKELKFKSALDGSRGG